MDELLFERVKQLQEIEDRLERMLAVKSDILHKAICDLINEVDVMIRDAKAAHAAF